MEKAPFVLGAFLCVSLGLIADKFVLDLKQNYFALFSLPLAFDIDQSVLTENYRALQKVVHPDKFAASSAQEKRLSMQAASYVNEAYQVLGSDLKRATYLLSLNGIDLGSETDTQVDPMFLMAQMEYREKLEGIATQNDPYAAVDALRDAIRNDVAELVTEVTGQLAGQDYSAARNSVRKWQFLVKITQELSDVEHQLEENEHG